MAPPAAPAPAGIILVRMIRLILRCLEARLATKSDPLGPTSCIILTHDPLDLALASDPLKFLVGPAWSDTFQLTTHEHCSQDLRGRGRAAGPLLH